MSNSKTTKRALISSVIALFLCFVMLLGATFAWFTDNAQVNVNTIHAGTLDIALEVKDASGNWVNAEGQTLYFKDKTGNTDILWEPGCQFETSAIRIVNNGNLSCKYKVVISGLNGDAKLNEVIDWYYSIDMSSIIPGGTGWTEPSDSYKLENFGSEDYLFPAGVAMNARTNAQVFKIIGKMQETAGNEYQKLAIDGIAITVVATQHTHENDINGDQYDANAEYPNVTNISSNTELKNALTESGTIILSNDVVESTIVNNQNDFANDIVDGQNVTLDLAGNTFTSTIKAFRVKSGGTLTIKSSANGGKIYVNSNTGGNRFAVAVEEGGTLNIEDGVVIEMKAFDTVPNAGAICNEGTVNMNGGEISLNTADGAQDGYKAYGLMCSNAIAELNNGTVSGRGFATETFDFGTASSTITKSDTFVISAVDPD